MTFLLIALLVAIAATTGFVLADSGLRMWSAVGAIRGQRAMTVARTVPVRVRWNPRVSTRVSYVRPAIVTASASRRAAA